MSIIIKGMAMPEEDTGCRIMILYDGQVAMDDGTFIPEYQAIEIPTPHGRLIEEHYPGELKAKHAEGVFIIYRSADEDTDRFILEEEAIS